MIVTIRNGECKHVKIHHYPDGQKNVTLDMEWFNNPKESVDIKCNIRNFSDLEILMCIVAALRKEDFFIKSIQFLYLFGMRSDRSFEVGMPNYVRDVLYPVINNLGIPYKKILDPHSKTGCGFLKAGSWNKLPACEGYIIIGADESAYNRQDSFPIFTCFFDKKRLPDGGVDIAIKNEFYSQIEDSPEHYPILVVDDLCDGGATFIAIGEFLEHHFPNRIRHLYITHGLFTKGIDHVANHYDKIITTNSVQDFQNHPKLDVIDVWS